MGSQPPAALRSPLGGGFAHPPGNLAAGGGFPLLPPQLMLLGLPATLGGQPTSSRGEQAWARRRPLSGPLSLPQVLPGPECHLSCRVRLCGLPGGTGGPQPLPPNAGQPRGSCPCGECGAQRWVGVAHAVPPLPPTLSSFSESLPPFPAGRGAPAILMTLLGNAAPEVGHVPIPPSTPKPMELSQSSLASFTGLSWRWNAAQQD